MEEEELNEEPTLRFEGSDGNRYKAKASEASALAQAAKAEGVTLKAIPGEEQKPVENDYWLNGWEHTDYRGLRELPRTELKGSLRRTEGGFLAEVEKVTAEEWETWKREYPEAFGRKLDDACGVCLDGWLISGAG